MREYAPNRFECCDRKLLAAFAFCPSCGARIHWRIDSPEDIIERQRAANVKTWRTMAETYDRNAGEMQMRLDAGHNPEYAESQRQTIKEKRKAANTLRAKADAIDR